jgi:uncharacterized protein
MSARLPVQIDPIRLADEGVRLAGELPLSEFPRLREMVRAGSGEEPVTIELNFERTVQGMRVMRGWLHTRLSMTCQRCLETVVVVLEAKPFAELLRPGERSTGGTDDAETLTVEGPQPLSGLVEDELLLVMPMVPMHDEGECAAPSAIGKVVPAPEKKPNPFLVLRERRAKDRQT